jgi:DNA-binding response OmpR family regulator
MKKKILIVDDEKNIRITVQRALQDMDLDIELAVDGNDALHSAQKKHPDIVLLDIRMPGMSGMEVLETLRKKYPDIRIIMISAHGTVENAVEALKLGACDFLRKPFTPDEIRTAVNDALKRKEGFFAHLVPHKSSGGKTPKSSPMDDMHAEEPLSDRKAEDLLQMTKDAVERLDFKQAERYARLCISADPAKPEAYNILGVLSELYDNIEQARKYYRAALSIQPNYEAAQLNLNRSDKRIPKKSLSIGNERKRHAKK